MNRADAFTAVITLPDGWQYSFLVYVEAGVDPSCAMSSAALGLLQDIQIALFSSGYIEGQTGKGRIFEVEEG